jgi:hypothetical protein
MAGAGAEARGRAWGAARGAALRVFADGVRSSKSNHCQSARDPYKGETQFFFLYWLIKAL